MEPIRTKIGSIKNPVDRFFAFARERHAIHERRQGRLPEGGEAFIQVGGHWTRDPILAHYRFTNVFRELDRVTTVFREKVRDPLSKSAEVLPATVLFRWFNRIETGRTLFHPLGTAPFDHYLVSERLNDLRLPLRKQPPPYVTGSYTINTRGSGAKTKQEGVLRLFHTWMKKDWGAFAARCRTHNMTLQDTVTWLQQDAHNLGPFMAYEVACDLRWTRLLCNAPDVMTWANPGPGAQRGVRRIGGERRVGDVRRPVDPVIALTAMRELLVLSQHADHWPRSWPAWEMREVEHTLCEFDKYERVRLGQGRPRGVFP